MSLHDRILELKQNASYMTGGNDILNAFTKKYCIEIDNEKRQFYVETKNKILKLLKNVDIDFEEKLLSALHEYNELVNYFLLEKQLSAVGKIERIDEGNTKKPDFKVTIDTQDMYIEMKTLGYANGNLNYKQNIDEGLMAQISIEEKLKGNRVASSVRTISPLKTNKKNYDSSSVKYVIEILIDKINQNIKEGQFQEGNTVLLIDLNLICLFSSYEKEVLKIYKDIKTNISGVLWNIAFGKIDDEIYKFHDFQNNKNMLDGRLEKEGILNQHKYIKGILFRVYELEKTKNYLVGLYRQEDSSIMDLFFNKLCNKTNTD